MDAKYNSMGKYGLLMRSIPDEFERRVNADFYHSSEYQNIIPCAHK